MGRQVPFTKVPSGVDEIDRLQDRLVEALRLLRKSPQQLLSSTGDLIYANAPNNPVRLPVGSAGAILNASAGVPAWLGPGSSGQVLTMSGGAPAWMPAAAGSPNPSNSGQSVMCIVVPDYAGLNIYAQIGAKNSQPSTPNAAAQIATTGIPKGMSNVPSGGSIYGQSFATSAVLNNIQAVTTANVNDGGDTIDCPAFSCIFGCPDGSSTGRRYTVGLARNSGNSVWAFTTQTAAQASTQNFCGFQFEPAVLANWIFYTCDRTNISGVDTGLAGNTDTMLATFNFTPSSVAWTLSNQSTTVSGTKTTNIPAAGGSGWTVYVGVKAVTAQVSNFQFFRAVWFND